FDRFLEQIDRRLILVRARRHGEERDREQCQHRKQSFEHDGFSLGGMMGCHHANQASRTWLPPALSAMRHCNSENGGSCSVCCSNTPSMCAPITSCCIGSPSRMPT